MVINSFLDHKPINRFFNSEDPDENNEDPDDIPHNAAFHQGLHCLLRQNRSSEREIQYYFGNYNLVTTGHHARIQKVLSEGVQL